MIVAIAGATGLTGSLCLQQLLQNPQISQVISIGRKPTGIAHAKLTEVQLVNNKLTQAIKAEAFICCLGTTIKRAGSEQMFRAIDLELPIHIAKNLKENGCTAAAVVSAMGANENSSFFYNRTKGQMEEAMKEVGFQSLSILRPSLIDGPRKEFRIMENLAVRVVNIINPLLTGKLKNYQSVKASSIAKKLISSVVEKKNGVQVYLSDEIKRADG